MKSKWTTRVVGGALAVMATLMTLAAVDLLAHMDAAVRVAQAQVGISAVV